MSELGPVSGFFFLSTRRREKMEKMMRMKKMKDERKEIVILFSPSKVACY